MSWKFHFLRFTAIGGFYDEPREGMNGVADACLLTTAPNAVLLPIHDRMPVIVREEDWERWLEPGEFDEQTFTRLTAPYSAQELQAVEVSPLVNSARVDSPECCAPVSSASATAQVQTPAPRQLELLG
ncbi:MAG TPA: SOS response-associated peptidase family protein [Chthoniobacteraceae bacterium]|nr:SOS response-associated peptidase family protein [Chthoniobacteraceae bacterium]